MKRIISDEELIAYVNGRLTKSENKRIREMAIQNGESDMLLNATLAYYESQKEYADMLLGEDEFAYTNNHPTVAPIRTGFLMAADKNFGEKHD